jgi:protoporphyrinogen/coproporphyrinogen III oxidase
VSDVLVLGGGISGLSAAYFLAQQGISSTLIEPQSRLGGLIKTDYLDHCQLEAGPDSYIAVKPEVTQLAAELPSLKDQTIGTNDAVRQIFLVKGGALVSLPAGMVMMVPANLRASLASPLFPPATKKRILQERFFKPQQRSEDVSIAEFVTDHFDRTILDYVAEPLLTGVYGGDVGRLSARSVLPRFLVYEQQQGSLVRAVQAERKQAAKQSGSMFLSFGNGMQSLVDALCSASASAVTHKQEQAEAVTRHGNQWRVTTAQSCYEAPALIVALPAHRAAPLFAHSVPALRCELDAIPYSSSITVTLVYREQDVAHPLNGFGYLVPRAERRQVAACTWIHRKFPQRIAPGLVALRAFIVDKNADRLLGEDDRSLVRIVREEFGRILGITAEPALHTVYRWPLSMPQYVVGHAERYGRIKQMVAEQPQLCLIGNAYEGVGIPDCVRLARAAAQQLSVLRLSHRPELPAPVTTEAQA